MTENNPNGLSREQQREEIKDLYRQRDNDIEIIPQTKFSKELLKETDEPVRVGLYTRVSTGSLEQASSIALQEVSFEDIQKFHPNWQLVETYTDEGISGTSIERRKGFQKMIRDAEAGKLDLIVTRSVSRFARNLMDCVKTYKHLASLAHPVYVFFVSNNLITNGKGEQSEMILNFMAMIAQEESHIKSDIMTGSIQQRFGQGKFLLSACLGYDRVRASLQERPYLKVNEEEAETIRYMYGLLLAGHACQKIAEILMEEGHKTRKGRIKWTAGTVKSVLRNEKYCGMVIAQKTFTIDYLNHKKKRNDGERQKYKKENHHPAIISTEVWTFAQKILDARTRNRKKLPTRVLSVVKVGILQGFVIVDRAWYGSSIDDYIEANRFAYPATKERPKQIKLGYVSNFDLSGYESVSSMLFVTRDTPTMSFDYGMVWFNKTAVNKMNKVEYIEILFNPKTFELAVRPTTKESNSAIKWFSKNGKNFVTYKTTLNVFTAMLYDYMEWNSSHKYKVYGQCREHDGEKILFFSLRDIEVLVPNGKTADGKQKYTKYYPKSFINQYGEDAYQSIYANRAYLLDYFKVWDACIGSVAVDEDEIEERIRKASEELLKPKE